MAAADSALRPRLARQVAPLLLASLALTYAVWAIVAINETTTAEATTTYATASRLAHAADICTGLALLGVGVVACVRDIERRLGSLATLLGVLWFAPDWEGWVSHPLVRSVGSLAAPLLLVLVFHLALAAPRGRLRSRAPVAAVIGAYAITTVLAVGRAFLRDPFLDPYCWRNCADNVFLVHANATVAHDLEEVLLGSGVAIGVLVLAVSGVRLPRASPAARRALAPLLIPAGLVGAAEAAYAAALLRNPLEDPRATEFSTLFLARSFAVAGLALGIAWSVLSARRARVAVARLTAELGQSPPPGKLQSALVSMVGDPTLRVAYWLEASRRLVGADGKRLPESAPGEGRAMTPIARGGRQVAVLTYDAGVVDGAALEREIGPAARLAVENERLQAEVLAELEDLRQSRTRIVEHADTERRRLERNLHDGAQQRLLALFYDLRLAWASAEADGHAELTELLRTALADTQAALEELRELAHGIYPAILSEAGLGPALATLADDASLPVELETMPDQRYGASIEAAAYFAVAEAVEDAAARASSSVRVDLKHSGGRLLVAIEDDGAPRNSALEHLLDRIGALGGSLDIRPTALYVSLPCA